MKIVLPDGEIDDNFGYAVSLSGNDGFIGAPYKEISGEHSVGYAHNPKQEEQEIIDNL